MPNRSDEITEQLKAAKDLLRRLEESLAKSQKLIEQTRQILDQAVPDSTSNRSSGNHKGTG
jgi:DNA anti-recombination protein RmuC